LSQALVSMHTMASSAGQTVIVGERIQHLVCLFLIARNDDP